MHHSHAEMTHNQNSKTELFLRDIVVMNKDVYNTKNLKSFIIVKAHCSMTHLKQQKSLGFF